ncbi:Selenide, water dikinase [Defluviimonas aquaemixtae]|uniref:Selenide, water dikinase n=1 Tax=Albidovulum aquaemixtae TaxID=1542388 RepID=A0A2R8B2C6_9RHOB|nr:selenide, water dikinase SelD [Defluviimonas aquaemixtae]SPH16784.1 Selenide, water dikinase [Defluviimonas aquaemixtae]
MQTDIPLTRDLVLIGGGHTHALILRRWGMQPLPGVRLTLINPEPTAAYSGMLPGFVAGHYAREELQIDLVRLARFAGARLIFGRATGIDRADKHVQVPGRATIGYDVASIDIGISSTMPYMPGFADHAMPAKPLDAFADRWDTFAASRAASGGRAAIAVIGAGVAGVELALAMRHRLGARAEITVIEEGRALTLVGTGARRALLSHLKRAGIGLVENAPAESVEADGVWLADGRKIASDFTLGAAAARAQGWLGRTGLALEDGFVRVGPTLQSVTDPEIFAVGDIAHLDAAPRPKAGVFAVRQAPVLLHNLEVALTETGRMRRYHPQRDYLKLISTGFKGAVADKWGLPLDGAWLWRWKDRIDRKFMAKLRDLPPMTRPELPARIAAGVRGELQGGKPLCGGCGSKVGQADLREALAKLAPTARPDVLSGPGDDAAILAHGKGHQVITTDHLRAFTEDPWLFATIAAVHAMGDVWSMGARPQAALAQVILPRMSPRLQTRTLAEVMEAASRVFTAEGADIVGGHTSVGAELNLGFTVTGLAAQQPVPQSGARPGDWLILTKPLGTGVILAAEMARAAPGGVVTGALASMARPQGAAARLLAPQAHAMTDVTGFGLAGHLFPILDASGTGARLSLQHIPVLPGAMALSADGHHSTLLPANRAVMERMFAAEGPRSDLLFDPQTAGGLLAAVPSEVALDVVRQLHDIGETAAVIGEVVEGPPYVTVED